MPMRLNEFLTVILCFSETSHFRKARTSEYENRAVSSTIFRNRGHWLRIAVHAPPRGSRRGAFGIRRSPPLPFASLAFRLVSA